MNKRKDLQTSWYSWGRGWLLTCKMWADNDSICQTCSSVTKLHLNLWDPTDYSTSGSSVLHSLPEFAQICVRWVGDAINHLILFCRPFSFCLHLSQHLGLFQWVDLSNQVAKILEFQLQHQSFQWIFRVNFLYDWLVWSPHSPRDTQESSLAPQFKSINSSALSLLYSSILTSIHDYWKNHSFDYMDLCW